MAKRRTAKTYFKKSYIIYIMAICIFATCVFLGAIKSSRLSQDEISYLSQITDSIFNGTYIADYRFIIKQSVLNSLKLVILVALLSLSVVTSFFSSIFIALNGFSIGLTSGFLIAVYKMKGFLYVIGTIAVKSIVYMPLLALLCLTCINYAIERKNKSENAVRFFAVLFIMFIIFAVINILDGIFSSFIIKGL